MEGTNQGVAIMTSKDEIVLASTLRLDVSAKQAQKVAKRLRGRTVIMYMKYLSVAHRFKSQLNENFETMSKYDIIAELAHNEINA